MLRAAPLVLLGLLGAGPSALEEEPDAFLQQLLAEPMEQRQELLRQHLAPTTVSIAAGRRTLAEAIGELRRTGVGDILLQLGTADQEVGELPALESTWWSALLTICRRFRVEPVPPMTPAPQHESGTRRIGPFRNDSHGAGQRIFGGPVQLRPATRQGPGSRLAQLHPSGPLLIETFDIAVTDVRHLKGTNRSADLRFRLRLQPGLRDDLVRYARVAWEAATTSDGTEMAIEQPAGQDLILRVLRDPQAEPARVQRRHFRQRRSNLTSSGRVHLDQLPANGRQVQLRGSAEFACGAALRLQVSLAPGDEERTVDSPVPIRCAFVEPAADDLQQRHRLSVSYRKDEFVAHPEVTISDPNGNPVRPYNRNSPPTDGDFKTDVYTLAGPLPGDYQIRIDGTVDLGTVLLPLLLQVPLP